MRRPQGGPRPRSGRRPHSRRGSWRASAALERLATDHAGSVRDVVDSAGNVIEHREYDQDGAILGVVDGLGGVVELDA
ncbi:MAG: hypothetical protein AAF266_10935, partial [Planctomycetota bacterium]